MQVKNKIRSLVDDGFEWLQINSKKLVVNLNAEYLIGFHGTKFPKKYECVIGDGVSTVYEIEHNLNTNVFQVIFFDGKTMAHPDCVVVSDSLSKCVITFSEPVGINKYKLLVIG